MYTFVLTSCDSNDTMCLRQFSGISMSTLENYRHYLFTWILLNQSKSEFLQIGCLKQLFKVSDVVLLVHFNVMNAPSDSACNLGVNFDSSLTISDHISAFLCIWILLFSDSSKVTSRRTLDSTNAKTIAASLIHSEEGH